MDQARNDFVEEFKKVSWTSFLEVCEGARNLSRGNTFQANSIFGFPLNSMRG